MKRRPLILFTTLLGFASAHAADLYVDNVKGLDTRDGLSATVSSETQGPLSTANAALAKVRPGDTIHFVATGTEYRQEISIRDLSGAPGKPITINGNGVVLNGADPCPKDGWEQADRGVWSRPNTSSRNILVIDGAIVLQKEMASRLESGQFCYEFGQFNVATIFFSPPEGFEFAKNKIEVATVSGETILLDTVEWRGGETKRYNFKGKPRPARILINGVESPLVAAKDTLQPGEWCNADGSLLLVPPKGKKVSDLNIELVVRQCGVQIGGSAGHVTSDIIIKDFNVRYVWNDAYNIHGKTKDVAFYNCNASDCFDEGFSAHDECETLLDGALYVRCDNGVMNVNKSGYSITRNIVVRDSRHKGFGVAVIDGEAWHELTNAVLINNPEPISARYLKAENVLVVESQSMEQPPTVSLAAPSTLKRATLVGRNLVFALPAGSGDTQVDKTVFTILEGGQGVLELNAKQNVIWNAFALRSNTKLLLTTGKTVAEKPLQEWHSGFGAASSQVALLPSGPKAVDPQTGKTLPDGCDPALWAKLAK